MTNSFYWPGQFYSVVQFLRVAARNVSRIREQFLLRVGSELAGHYRAYLYYIFCDEEARLRIVFMVNIYLVYYVNYFVRMTVNLLMKVI